MDQSTRVSMDWKNFTVFYTQNVLLLEPKVSFLTSGNDRSNLQHLFSFLYKGPHPKITYALLIRSLLHNSYYFRAVFKINRKIIDSSRLESCRQLFSLAIILLKKKNLPWGYFLSVFLRKWSKSLNSRIFEADNTKKLSPSDSISRRVVWHFYSAHSWP